MKRADTYDLERSHEIERRLDRDEEREPRRMRRALSTVTSRMIHTPPETDGPHLRPWVWPLPDFDRIQPITLAVHPEHVELGYQAGAVLPRLVPVFAARDGVCVYAGKGGESYAACIDHPGGWSTQYGNLKHVLLSTTDRFRRRRKQRVRAGDTIGYTSSPIRVRFTLAKMTDADEGLAPIDPSSQMKQWLVLPWTSAPARTFDDLAA